MRRPILFVPLVALFASIASINGLAGCGATEGPEEGGEATPSGDVEGGNVEDASPSDGEPPTEASVVPQRPPFDWVGVVGTGQSLSVGARAADVVSKSQPFENKMLVDNGPNPRYPLTGGAPKYALVPLTEPVRPLTTRTGNGYIADTQYPNNIYGETPSSGMANQISALFLARSSAAPYVTLHSVVGWSGRRLVDLDKEGGKRSYLAALAEARAFTGLAKAAGKTFGYGAVVLTHGEADVANASYGTALDTFIADYNDDLKAITGQSSDVMLLVSQQSARGSGRGTSAVQVWLAGQRNARIVCTGPKYQFGYADDDLHMPAPGYRRLGEKYGEVFDVVVNQKKAWRPVGPSSAKRAGATIEVQFDVPNPPLQWDTTLAPNHQTVNTAWAKGRGFEVRDAADKALTITTVAISAPNTVTITLSAPTTGPVTVGYALTPDTIDSGNGGTITGLRGQLRDSDDLVGQDKEALEVTLTKGSPVVTLRKGSLAGRALRDVLTGSGVPASWTVLALASPTSMTMSAPWPGDTGPAKLDIHHDLHNYAVHSFIAAP